MSHNHNTTFRERSGSYRTRIRHETESWPRSHSSVDPAIWWGEGDYESRERAYAPIHDHLIDRIDPRPGERVLDVACGLGAVAARVSQRCADVTAIDISPTMIERASRRVEPVNWQIGDCESLPFDDDSFDVVVSSFGVIFAPHPQRAAAELSRVCRDRFALTAWIADPGRDLWNGCLPAATASRVWSSEAAVADLLSAFEVVTEEGVWWLHGPTGEAIWSWMVRTSPPVRARLGQLSPAQGEDVRAASIRRYEQFRIGDSIHLPQMYLLSVGQKCGC